MTGILPVLIVRPYQLDPSKSLTHRVLMSEAFELEGPMDTLRDRLAELADDAPSGGAPATELWARGKRAYRLRAGALAATLLVVGAVGTGIGVRLVDDDGNRAVPAPAVTVGIALPIEYPVGEELSDLGAAPGPLAAIWVTPGVGGGAPQVVGLVAKTGAFGTLAIDAHVEVEYKTVDPDIALSPDGRRIAYNPRKNDESGEPGDPVVHDLVTGEDEFPTINNRGLGVYDWIDATHLYGSAGTSVGVRDTDGWVWEPGKEAKLHNLGSHPGQPYLGFGWPYGGTRLSVVFQSGAFCERPARLVEDPPDLMFEVPMLCDVVGVVGSEILLGHWNSEHTAGESTGPRYAKGTVVALDIGGADLPYLDPAVPRGPGADHAFEDPARSHVVVTAGAPLRVAFATDLIGQALKADGGAS
jgi:hypothetical protein